MTTQDSTQAAGPTPTITGHTREIEARVIAQAIQDPAFRARLLADPKGVFAEMGLQIPPGVQIQTLEESAKQYYLVLPTPAHAEQRVGASLSDAELEAVAGGASSQVTSWTGCASGSSGCIDTGNCPDTSFSPGP